MRARRVATPYRWYPGRAARKGRPMTTTSTRAGRAATGADSGTAGHAGSQVLRAAGRQLLATAGNQVLKVAVDRPVGTADYVAGRLSAVASGERRKPWRPPTPRKPTPR